MRCIVLFATVGALSFCPLTAAAAKTPAQPDTASYIVQLERMLISYPAQDSIFEALRFDFQRQYPAYQKWMTAAHQLTRRGRYSIVAIMQRHEEPHMTRDQELLMFYSQFRIAQLLDSLNCDVVGAEGIYVDRMTWSTLQQQVYDETRYWHGPGAAIDTLRYHLILVRNISMSNGMHHFIRHPRAVIIGSEDSTLFRLQLLMLRKIYTLDMLGLYDSRVEELFMAIVRARSEMAVVKTLRALAARNRYRGAIVIGLGHLPEFTDIFPRYQLPSTILFSDPSLKPAVVWWK